MYINKKLAAVNGFRPHAIPTARKLFERYGYSRVQDGHPDNTDPYHFNTPSNLTGVVPGVGAVALGGVVADSLRPKPETSKPAEPQTSSSETETPAE